MALPPSLLADVVDGALGDSEDHVQGPFDHELGAPQEFIASSVDPEVQKAMDALSDTPEGDLPSPIKDIYWVAPGRQVLRLFHKNPNDLTQDLQDGEDIILGDLETPVPDVSVVGFAQNVDFDYDVESKEIRISYYQFDKNAGPLEETGKGYFAVPDLKQTGRKRLVAMHVIKDVSITNLEGQPILRDGNFAMFATDEGLRGFMELMAQDLAFKAPIPTPVIQPSIRHVDSGAKITRMDFATPENAPRKMVTLDGEPVETLSSVDLMLQVETSSGKVFHTPLSYQEAIFPWARQVYKPLFLGLQLANPELDEMNITAQILRDEAEANKPVTGLELEQMAGVSQGASVLQSVALQRIGGTLSLGKYLHTLSGGPKSDSFGQVEGLPAYVYSASDDPEGEWANNYQRIQDVRSEAGNEKMDWFDALAISYQRSEDILRQKAIAIEQARASGWSKFKLNVRKIVRKKPMIAYASLIAGSAVAIDIAQKTTDGEFGRRVLWAMNWAHEHALQYVPGEAQIVEFVKDAPQIFGISWGFSNVVIAGTIAAAFLPAALWVAQRSARLAGHDWSKQVAGFTYMMRAYGKIDKPRIRKAIIEKVLKLKNLYPAKERGVDLRDPGVFASDSRTLSAVSHPIQTAKSAMNKITGQRLETQPKEVLSIDSIVVEKQERNRRAMIIAAAAVSQAYSQTSQPIDPATLMLLLKGESANQLTLLLNSLSTPEVADQWNDLAKEVYRELARNVDARGVGDVNEETIHEYAGIFEKLVEKVSLHDKNLRFSSDVWPSRGSFAARDYDQTPFELAGGWIKSRWEHFTYFTSNDVIPYVLMGSGGMETDRLFSNITMDERNADTAYTMAVTDYNMSVGFYALADPASFANWHQFSNIVNTVRIGMDQAEQVFIWTSVGGVDVWVTNQPDYSPSLPSKALSDSIYRRDRSPDYVEPEKGGTGSQMSWLESGKTIGANLFDPDAKHTIFKTHIRKMDASIQGFKARFYMRFLPLAIGFTFLGVLGHMIGGVSHEQSAELVPQALEAVSVAAEAVKAAGAGDLEGSKSLAETVLMNIVQAVPGSAAVLLNKMALGVSSAGVFLVGYATIWSPIIWAMNVVKDKSEKSLSAIRSADYWLDKGLRLKNEKYLKRGIQQMMSLYEQSGSSVPRQKIVLENLEAASLEDLMQTAASLQEHSLEQPPLTSVNSKSFATFLNAVGTVISVALYVALSKSVVGASAEGNTPELFRLLGFSMGMFASTYFLLKFGGIPGASAITRKLQLVRQGYVQNKAVEVAGSLRSTTSDITQNVSEVFGDSFPRTARRVSGFAQTCRASLSKLWTPKSK